MQLLFVLLPPCLFWCVVAYKPRCNIMVSIYFFEFQTFYSYQICHSKPATFSLFKYSSGLLYNRWLAAAGHLLEISSRSRTWTPNPLKSTSRPLFGHSCVHFQKERRVWCESAGRSHDCCLHDLFDPCWMDGTLLAGSCCHPCLVWTSGGSTSLERLWPPAPAPAHPTPPPQLLSVSPTHPLLTAAASQHSHSLKLQSEGWGGLGISMWG